jgi:DNA-binding response OmpR family regulator
MKNFYVLIAESSPEVVQQITAQVAGLGLALRRTASGPETLDCLAQREPDAIILRDTLPERGGFETARLIRAVSDVPIIFTTGQPDRLSRQRALHFGDEYLALPGQLDRLPARLTALLQRRTRPAAPVPDGYDDGYLRVVISQRAVTRAGNAIDLTETEFNLLSCFVRHQNQALSYTSLLESAWGHRYPKAKSEVSQYVRYLRQKIEADPAQPVYLQSVRSLGYMFLSRI